MRQLHWGLKAEFPYAKVFILGIILTVLGCTCVVVSVVGIAKLAWGYYVSTGMWGGVTITISGIAAMYAARVQTSVGVRLYCFLSVLTCLVSFAMIVLSAGGLTYKSNFYQPMIFDDGRHQVTLFLHGYVLSVGVLSLACNVLSVIVYCKFRTKNKDRVESFKLRRHRYRYTDPNAVYRRGSLRDGSGTVRSSSSSRTPLFGSDRSRKHSRQASETDSTNLKIPGERGSHRRDSDRSKGSSRSRHSHHRQSSSVSQHSRQSAPMEAEVTTILLRDTDSNTLSSHIERESSQSLTDNIRDSQADTLTDSMSVQLVFDPDEEPLPPYEEARPVTFISSDGNESDTETVEGSSSIVMPSGLPLNIPVSRTERCQTQSLQRQPPPQGPSSTEVSHNSQQIRAHSNSDTCDAMSRITSEPNSPGINSDERDNRFNMMRMSLSDQRTRAIVSPNHQDRESSDTHPSENGSASPEICALTGERMTPVAAVQPDTVPANNSSTLASCVSQHNPSPDSSDTSTPGDAVTANHVHGSSHSQKEMAHPVSSASSSALPAGIQSPSSAFRPVGKRIVPLAQASPSHSVPVHNLFSPISSPGSAHFTVYSPVASPSSATRFVSPASPSQANNMASSSESLSRGDSGHSLLWKKIPLPSSHNHSNRTSSVPFKEISSKTIPGPSHTPKKHDCHAASMPRHGSKDMGGRVALSYSSKNVERAKNKLASDYAETKNSTDHHQVSKFASPVRRPPEAPVPLSGQRFGQRPSQDDCSSEYSGRSAFVSRQPGATGNHSITSGTYPPGGSSKSAAGGASAGVSSQPGNNSSQCTNASDHRKTGGRQPGPANMTGHHASSGTGGYSVVKGSHFIPVGHPPEVVGSQSSGKPLAPLGSPSKVARDQVTGVDPSRRSAGCQATDDGGIASSMDRTHRWVMGTLPSGTRFQGTTKNTALLHGTARNTALTQGAARNVALIHGASRNSSLAQGTGRNTDLSQSTSRNSAVHSSPGTRSSLLAPVNRHSSGRSHGVWTRPSKGTSSAVAPAVAAPVASMSTPVASVSAPVTSVVPPVASVSAPVASVSAPLAFVAAPVAAVSVPVASMAAPVASMAAPVASVAAPAIGVPVSVAAADGFSSVPQRGFSSSRLPRYYPTRQCEVQPSLQPPLQPIQLPHRHLQQAHQPQLQQQFQMAQGEEQDLDQQQGKPLFSVLL